MILDLLKRLYSPPIRSGVLKGVLTFIYFVAIALIINIGVGFWTDTNYLQETNVVNAEVAIGLFIVPILLALAVTLVIHRSLPLVFLTYTIGGLFVSLILFVLYGDGPDGGFAWYLIGLFIFSIIFFPGITLFALCRKYYQIESKLIRIFILVIPFIILAIIYLFIFSRHYFISDQNCNDLGAIAYGGEYYCKKEISKYLLKKAISDNQITSCFEILNGGPRYECLTYFFKNKSIEPDLNLCSAKGKTDYICIEAIALYLEDMSICSKLDDEYSKNHCAYDIAILSGDIRSCEDLLDSWKSSCYKEFQRIND